MATKRNSVSRDDPVRVVPVVAERLKIGRRRIESGRVVVNTTTRSEDVVVDEPIRVGEVSVERVPIGRFVDAPVEPRFEGDALIVPVLEEVVVVTRRLRLVEELRIRRRTVTRRHRETVKLRRQSAEIENEGDTNDEDHRGDVRFPGRR